MTKEIWRDVKGYEGLYQVSTTRPREVGFASNGASATAP